MIDETDRKILHLLQKDGRISHAEIARNVGRAPSAVLERIRRMERQGIIRRYETRVDPSAFGLGLTTFILVRTEEAVGSIDAGEELARIPEVQEVYHTAGHFCYLCKVRVRDTNHMAALLREFGKIESVSDTRTTLVLSTIKEDLAIPLEEVRD